MEDALGMIHMRQKTRNIWLCKLGSWIIDTCSNKSARGALEPQFFAALLKGLGIKKDDLPGPREDPFTWPELKLLFTKIFKSKSRKGWEAVFDGTDACCTPVLSQSELEASGFDQRPVVTLRDTPSLAIADGSSSESHEAIKAAKGQGEGVPGQGWDTEGLSPSAGGEDTLKEWLGWTNGVNYEVVKGGLSLKSSSKL
jgi:alpha-methylacyl-CoA racemase